MLPKHVRYQLRYTPSHKFNLIRDDYVIITHKCILVNSQIQTKLTPVKGKLPFRQWLFYYTIKILSIPFIENKIFISSLFYCRKFTFMFFKYLCPYSHSSWLRLVVRIIKKSCISEVHIVMKYAPLISLQRKNPQINKSICGFQQHTYKKER